MAMNTSKTIHLYGDKQKKAEPATHLIKFPGGAIELSRTSDNTYWAHITVNHGQVLDDAGTFNAARGEVIEARIDRDYPHGSQFSMEGEGVEYHNRSDALVNLDQINHVALRIKAVGE